ncbi:DNA polymerase III subunit epsilon [Pseudomonas putida]|uniref:DNA polymerase III subunit epsilon n=1 Tax=Pseudomonas putida TaxID=303 RepID=A0A8I1JIV2_PSEPU|nr:DNA polymerase III subunit epsilon [Pseudomonas putida]
MSTIKNYAEIDWDDAVDGVVYDLSDPENDRELVMDTETTGFLYDGGDRVIEIGIVEVIGRKETGRIFHCYIDPKRDVPEEAFNVHGLSRDDLVEKSGGRGFEHFAERLLAFVGDSTLIAHNSKFDMNFLDSELKRFGFKTFKENGNKVIDSLLTANLKHPNMANNLNALCRRYSVDISNRELHGALLDASLLSKVYRAMTVSQVRLELGGQKIITTTLKPERLSIPAGRLKKATVSQEDVERHNALCGRISKASGGKCLASSLAP